ncbi:MAG: hypothetical protein N2316_08185, partial [Spirochaetes bacterium]|nr:hypothetical protein [Spirochaetota bacterium]
IIAGCEYSHIWLSGIPLRTLAIQIGVSYNIFTIPTEEKVRARRAEEKLGTYLKANERYIEGAKLFEKGEIQSAKSRFLETLTLVHHHPEAELYLNKISEIENEYARGKDLIEKKNFYAAIPHLERAAKFMNHAQKLLQTLRSDLAINIPTLESRGIQAYEKSDYATCIELMHKLQLIDPNNKTVAIYLPRAKKRFEGEKKLK